MPFNYNKLRGKIREVLGTQKAYAEALGLSSVSVSSKLNNGVEFSQQEIMTSVRVLGIDPNEIPEYFFAQMVEKTEQ